MKHTLPAGRLRAIYIDTDRLKINKLYEKAKLPLTPLPCHVIFDLNAGPNWYVYEVQINGPSTIKGVPHIPPLTPDGPAEWVETDAELEVLV